jgi:hypothetical protein
MECGPIRSPEPEVLDLTLNEQPISIADENGYWTDFTSNLSSSHSVLPKPPGRIPEKATSQSILRWGDDDSLEEDDGSCASTMEFNQIMNMKQKLEFLVLPPHTSPGVNTLLPTLAEEVHIISMIFCHSIPLWGWWIINTLNLNTFSSPLSQ